MSDPFGKIELMPRTQEQVERDFQHGEDRRHARDHVKALRARFNTARAVAQSFDEYSRAFRKVAPTKGTEADHAVAEHLAEHCENQAAEYEAKARSYTAKISEYETSE